MNTPTPIYCASGNRRFAETAIGAGFRYGGQLPNTVYFPLYFADQDWKKYSRAKPVRKPAVRAAYMQALAQHKPHMATVLDWEHEEQLDEVLSWAEEAAQYTENVLLIPKVHGGIQRLPRTVGGKRVVLAYSVPSGYAGTKLSPYAFAGWPVHLLGGQPQGQMGLFRRMSDFCEVVSVDGNFAQKMAVRHCQYWEPGDAYYAINKWWPSLREANGGKSWGHDAPYEAFRRSCVNIMAAWQRLGDYYANLAVA